MSQKKGPVIFIAAIFLGLILVPVFIFFGPGVGGGGSRAEQPPQHGGSARASDLEELARQARLLVSDRLAAALRRGEIDLETMGEFNRQLQRAEDLQSRGRGDQARAQFEQLIESAETELARFELADKARSLEASLSAQLAELAPLQSRFPNAYAATQSVFEEGKQALAQNAFSAAVDAFEETEERVQELAERGVAVVQQLLETGDARLKDLALEAASEAYEDALRIDAGNRKAIQGLEKVSALEGIQEEIAAIDLLIADGRLDAALRATEALLETRPDNPVLSDRRKSIRDLINARDFENLLAEADAAEERGDLVAAIDALEAALEIRADSSLVDRLRRIVEERRQIKLETTLGAAFARLQAADYPAARDLYREALSIDESSEEAQQGLERSARLLIAEVEFRENLEAAARTAEAGRFPLAATFFNRAMATRPSNLPETERERSLRQELEVQSEQVTVTIRSDNRTFVSIIGVLPPEQFRTKELSVFPDVYKVRGTRRGEADVEIELRVNAREGPKTITVTNR